MTVLASIVVDNDEFELGRVLASTETRIDLTQFIPIDQGVIPYFWKKHGGDIEVFEKQVRDHPSIAELVKLDGRIETHLYQLVWADGVDVFLDALRAPEIMIEEGFTNHGEKWLFRLRAADQQALSTFQQTCHDSGISLDIRRVVHNPDNKMESWPLAGVTQKQRDALVLAFERGYFDVPRGASATELGKELGVSRQSFSRRLQRAQQTIFANLIRKLEEI